MKDEELILKAVEYCNDIPARVKDFLRETTKESDTKEAPKPKFKVGDWVNWNGCHQAIGRIVKHCNSYKDSWSLEVNGDLTSHNSCNEDNLSLSTPAEIKDLLMKVAKEKGLIGAGLCLKDANDGVLGISYDQYYEYRTDYDSLVVSSKGDEFAVTNLYYQGKWATIIPLKKKLPMSKGGIILLIKEMRLAKDIVIPNTDIDDFLDLYED